ncbi:hypothetical protein ECSTECC16502_0271 [Escherichia coli STEC_C165-02]|nr:hypothetical protein ECSTECC16502_0271 [Escherichia coli STEC_C165-02]
MRFSYMGLLVVDLNAHQIYTAAPDATLPRLIRPTNSGSV